MDSVFLKIKAGLPELFPDAQNMDIRPDNHVLCNESTTVDDVVYHLEMAPA